MARNNSRQRRPPTESGTRNWPNHGKKRKLTVSLLHSEAARFAKDVSKEREPKLFGVADGKRIGTYLEHKFQAHLEGKYTPIPRRALTFPT